MAITATRCSATFTGRHGAIQELDAHLHQLEEAERRDHRRIGKDMGLFHFQEEAVGSVFWHPKGWKLFRNTEDYLRRRAGRERLPGSAHSAIARPCAVGRSPAIGTNTARHMFVATVEDENKTLAVKPMNCPCHILIFRRGACARIASCRCGLQHARTRLGAEYVGEDGARHVPVMLHRAIRGSFERVLGNVIEHYAGRFPLWLAPVQVVVATIVSDADDYAREVVEALTKAGLTAQADLTNQKINAKVRDHSLACRALPTARGG